MRREALQGKKPHMWLVSCSTVGKRTSTPSTQHSSDGDTACTLSSGGAQGRGSSMQHTTITSTTTMTTNYHKHMMMTWHAVGAAINYGDDDETLLDRTAHTTRTIYALQHVHIHTQWAHQCMVTIIVDKATHWRHNFEYP